MKSKLLKNMKDGAKFRISKRISGAVYEMVKKWKNKEKVPMATISAILSKRSYIKPQTTVVYPL